MHAIGGRVLIVLLAGTITCSVGVSLAAQDEAMSGYGTATIDGTKASGEWCGMARRCTGLMPCSPRHQAGAQCLLFST